jgi:DNA-binding transcriptional LysR family regulator
MRKTGLVELDAVVAVARRRSFRAAAVEVGVSTTALSNAVSGLETRIGARLFHRTTRSVSLTEAGEQFVATVAPALAEIRGAVDAVNKHRTTPTGTLRINSSLGAAHRMMAPFVIEYLRRYPEMRIDLAAEQRLVDIVAEGFDAGIRLTEDIPRDMIAVRLGMAVRFVVVAAPSVLHGAAQPKHPNDLAAHPCICVKTSGGAPYRWEFARGRRRVSVDVAGPLILNAPTLMREAALAGVGMAYLGEGSVAEDLDAGRLVRVLGEWMPPASELALYYPGHRYVPTGLRTFVDVVRDIAQNLKVSLASGGR